MVWRLVVMLTSRHTKCLTSYLPDHTIPQHEWKIEELSYLAYESYIAIKGPCGQSVESAILHPRHSLSFMNKFPCQERTTSKMDLIKSRQFIFLFCGRKTGMDEMFAEAMGWVSWVQTQKAYMSPSKLQVLGFDILIICKFNFLNFITKTQIMSLDAFDSDEHLL